MFHFFSKKYITTLFMLLAPLLFLFGSQQEKIKIGIDENLGAKLPMDAVFVKANGDTLKLSEMVNKPFLLDLVYYNCPGICHPFLSELVWAVDRLQMANYRGTYMDQLLIRLI